MTGDHIFVVKRVDKGVALAFLQFQSLFIGVIIAAFNQTDICAVAFCGLNLGDWCAVRQANQRFDSIFCGSQRNTLCVVSCGAGDDALCLFFFGQHCDFIGGASDLKRSGDLKIFGFQIQLALRCNTVGSNHIGFPNDALQHRLRVKYLV